MMDVASVALIIWILTGVIMWWMLPGSRSWGWVAIAGGIVCFVVLVSTL